MNGTLWRKAIRPALLLALALGVLDLVFRVLSAPSIDRVPAAFTDAVRDTVVIAVIAAILGALSPVLRRLWVALSPVLGPPVRAVGRFLRWVRWPWVVFALVAIYFVGPLIATIHFSLTIHRWPLSLDAYTNVFQSPEFQGTFLYSLGVGLAAIVVGLLIVVPGAYFVRLRAPQLRPIIEFVTLLPLIIPPIILVFGYIRMYSSSSILPLTNSVTGTNVLLTLAYVALALPYMYRAVDTGLRTIDVQTLTEAANILGAKTPVILIRIIFPNIIVAVLSGAFLTLAIVIGEFTIASLLNRPAFGVYMQNVGANRAFEPAALAVISFAVTWIAMGMIQLLARFAPRTTARN